MSRRRTVESPATPTVRWMWASFISIALIFCLLSWYMGWIHGVFDRVLDACADIQTREKVVLESILVSGRIQADKKSILDSIDLPIGTPMMFIHLKDVQSRLEKNPWVKTARVERHFPHTLKVIIEERSPIARWQKDQKIMLLGEEGQAIPVTPDQRYNTLPLFVGMGANENAHALLSMLDRYPEVKKQFSSSVWAGQRRWNLILHNGWTVRLPQKGQIKALQELEKTLNNKSIVKQNIEVVDLRIPGRMTLVYKKKPFQKRRRNDNYV